MLHPMGRPKGQGTIVPIPPSPGGTKRWRVAVTMPDGRRVWRTAHSPREAERIRAQLVEARELGLDPTRQTLAAYLRGWIDAMALHGRVRPRTLDHYRLIVETHIVPALGSLKLSAVTGRRVQAHRRGQEHELPRAEDGRGRALVGDGMGAGRGAPLSIGLCRHPRRRPPGPRRGAAGGRVPARSVARIVARLTGWLAEREGFEPPEDLRPCGFQDRTRAARGDRPRTECALLSAHAHRCPLRGSLRGGTIDAVDRHVADRPCPAPSRAADRGARQLLPAGPGPFPMTAPRPGSAPGSVNCGWT